MGCFKIEKEDYNEIQNSCNELLDMLRELKEINFEDKTYSIEYYLGGDLKFLALALGINQSTGHYPCIWCKTKKENFIKDIHNQAADRVLKSKSYFICN